MDMGRLYHYGRTQVFGRKGDPIRVEWQRSHKDCPPHDHHDFIEIVLAAGGTGLQETAGRQLPIQRGSVTVLRPGHWHAYHQCRRLEIYNLFFGPELLRRELAWLVDDPKLTWLLWGTGDSRGGNAPPDFSLKASAVTRLKAILDDLRRSEAGSYGIKVAKLCLFLTSLSHELPAPPSPNAGRMHPLVLKCIRQVEGDLAREWSVRELAREANCSPEYLIRLFRTAIGMTPYAFISRCRAERAAMLLIRSQATIAEIGGQVGWAEPCHFARRFRRQFGRTATAYRAQMRA